MQQSQDIIPKSDVFERYVLHQNDIPADLRLGPVLAIDCVFMGGNVFRDRLSLLQVYDGEPESKVHIIKFDRDGYATPHLRRLLSDAGREKLFFYARADMKWIGHYLGTVLTNVSCLRTESRIARTYTQTHELEDLCRQMLGIKIPKDHHCASRGQESLTSVQLDHICHDVLYLHALKEKLAAHLHQEGRAHIAAQLAACLPAVVAADLAGWDGQDLFAYQIPKP